MITIVQQYQPESLGISLNFSTSGGTPREMGLRHHLLHILALVSLCCGRRILPTDSSFKTFFSISEGSLSEAMALISSLALTPE